MDDIIKLKDKIDAALYRHRNGAAVESMMRMGGQGSQNYGVELTVIRRIASRYAPCQPLADMLYYSDVREHRLAALYIADPLCFDADKTASWMRDVATTEIADCASQALFCKIPGIIATALPLIGESPILSHTAIMSAARALTTCHDMPDAVTELLKETSKIKERTDHTTLSAFTFMITALGRAGYAREASEFIDTLPEESKRELEWLKE